VDDHQIFRDSLRALLEKESDIKIIGEAKNGVEAVRQFRDLSPDVVLLDLMMPQKTGLEAISEIKEHDAAVRILVLSSYGDDYRVRFALSAGAVGYVLKDIAPVDLFQAIRVVYEGRSYFHPSVTEIVRRKIYTANNLLTEREFHVLKLVALGMTNEMIAEKFTISIRTVRTHVSHILGKLQVDNRTQAALYALKLGLISQDDVLEFL